MKTIAIAGASGFIGRWFIEKFKHKYRIIALSRRAVDSQPADENVEWRKVELYSITSTTEALQGADYALYLVHSMSPSTRLNQGSFEETDLLLADNFARASSANNLAHILFVGGILPKDKGEFSPHLRSRYEVEQTLASRSTPVTTLRGGIIIGPGGSSFSIVEKLVKRLPIMICPSWTLSKSQPIALQDVLQLIDHCIGNASYFGRALEMGGKEKVSYMQVLQITAKLMGIKRIIFPFPFFSPGFSKLWVALFSDSSTTFISPLIESLKHTMTIDEDMAVKDAEIEYTSLEDMIHEALYQKDNIPRLPKFKPNIQTERNTVRSHQRLPNPRNKEAFWIADRYLQWLPRFFKYIIQATVDEQSIATFSILGIPLLKLQAIKDRSDEERQLMYIIGGYLVKRKDYGWLEFRSILDGKYVISVIHEFVPKLPWYIYILTQAPMHLWVMNSFGSYLKKMEYTKDSED